MSHTGEEHQIQRILVALDSSAASMAALKQAVALAAHFKAGLLGLYVEDITLVQLAQISFTQEVGLFSASRRSLEVRYVERQFKGQANRARQAMATLAEQAGVAWTFRVVRGVIAKELLSAASDADLIVLGRVGLSGQARRDIGSTARALLLESPHLTLVLHPETQVGLPVIALYNGSATAQKGLIAATQLMPEQAEPLIVVVIAESAAAAQPIRQQAEQTLQEHGLKARFITQSGKNIEQLIQTIQARACRMLILPANGSGLDRETALSILNRVHCPVLLVR